MDDDLNTADAIAAIFDIVYASNTALSNENKNAKVLLKRRLTLYMSLAVYSVYSKRHRKSR